MSGVTQAAAECLQRGYFHFQGEVTMEFNSSSAPFGICSINGFGVCTNTLAGDRITNAGKPWLLLPGLPPPVSLLLEGPPSTLSVLPATAARRAPGSCMRLGSWGSISCLWGSGR